MLKRFGVCEWSVPLKGEELFAWLKEHEVGNVSLDFDYETCKNDETRAPWCEERKALSEKYGVDISILAINTLCTYGMNHKEQEEIVKDILEKGIETASILGAPAVHLPSFVNGEIKSREELEQVIVILNYACRLGEKYQVQIGYESPLNEKDLGYLLKRVSGETFYVLFDNENVSLRGIDPTELYLKYKKWYRHTHLKTASAEKFIRPMEEETSFGGIGKVIEAMNANGFEGWIISETDYWKEPDREKWETVFEKDKLFIKREYQL